VKQFIIDLFTDWKRPIIFFAFSLTSLCCIGLFLNNIPLENIAFYLCIFSVLTIIFSIIYQLVKGRFLRSLLTLCILGIGVVIFFYFLVAEFWKVQSLPDRYADNLTIPKNIKINLPSDSAFSFTDTIPNFQLYNSIQPGIYSYVIWTRKIDKGYCYLKAFEVTENDPLSVDRLRERSRVEIFNPTDNIVKFSMGKTQYNEDRDFTIYEGDWGKPYAARFEVWFVPANGERERKLIEKNFKIEGWMR
jgi:hypothetical protein